MNTTLSRVEMTATVQESAALSDSGIRLCVERPGEVLQDRVDWIVSLDLDEHAVAGPFRATIRFSEDGMAGHVEVPVLGFIRE